MDFGGQSKISPIPAIDHVNYNFTLTPYILTSQ